jgi:maltooligosyltrehalose trehalohydrolase
VWAPFCERVEARVAGSDRTDTVRTIQMEAVGNGYHSAVAKDVAPGARYRYRLGGVGEFPDPASRFQPEGVHGPSEVVDPTGFAWSDRSWSGLALSRYVIYEVHTGTFSGDGTFDQIAKELEYLRELGVTSLEVMPVGQFPGTRNWGYDGAFPYAVQASYGGPDGLRRLVNESHRRGLAVVLDVVYNHLGPEGNNLGRFGPYFTDRYRIPWGQAINFDGPGSDEVRRYFIGNALYWFEEFHVDALRLDAVQGIVDNSARPFLLELAEATDLLARRLSRPLHLIAESDLGDPRVVERPEAGGLGMDAQWTDDLHHSLRALLTGERAGHYRDYGSVEHVARAYRGGYVYQGQHSAARGRRHGASTRSIPAHRFVVFAQNHDQVGNRAGGDRLSTMVGFEQLKLAAGVILLSPFIPMLFMGEEYGETAPFHYFISHSDPGLAEAVRRARAKELAFFGWDDEPPDAQDEATFLRSKLDRRTAEEASGGALVEFYRELLRLRREMPALARLSKDDLEARSDDRRRTLVVRRWAEGHEVLTAFNFGDRPAEVSVPASPGLWSVILDSADSRWGGPRRSGPSSLPATPNASISIEPGAFVLLEAARPEGRAP